MKMSGEEIIAAPIENVWAALNDPKILQACIPGCETIKQTSPTDFEARVVIKLDSGLELAFSPKQAQGLEHAHPADLTDAEITPSGLGIHFPKLDADLYIPALLEGFLGSKRWMAAEAGKIGGASSSVAKAAAARKNGKLGGRPKKTKVLLAA